MKKSQKKKKNNLLKKGNITKIVVTIVLLLLISIGVSFAYFTANISGSESATTITVGGGTLGITYADSTGSAITVSNIYPRAAAWATKTFYVKGNTATTDTMKYKCTLKVTTNTFSGTALKWQMTSANAVSPNNNGTIMTAKTTNQNIAAGASDILLGNGEFIGPVNLTNHIHTYVLTIYFPDTPSNQNVDQGKTFTAYIKTEAVAPV